MTYEVNFVSGQRGSACVNDAFSLVTINQEGQPNVLGFIPAAEIPGKTQKDVLRAFEDAGRQANSDDANTIVTYTKRALQSTPVPQLVA